MKTEETIPIQVVAYRDICQHPEEDTLRLKYADLLDELGDGRAPCPACSAGPMADAVAVNNDCPKCGGTGTVLSTANRDRAEFVRVQIALAPFRQVIDAHAPEPVYTPQVREQQLLAAHPEWSGCSCPGCEVEGVPIGVFEGGVACRTCGGTGDLFVRLHPAGNGDRLPRPVTFSRGFLDSVECTAADVWREEVCGRCSGDGRRHGSDRPFEWTPDPDAWKCTICHGVDSRRTVPTEWALAVVQCAPVTRFILTSGIPDTLGEFPEFLRDGGTDGDVDELAAQVGKWVRSKAF